MMLRISQLHDKLGTAAGKKIRCSLKLCSKSDYQIVKSTKFEFGKLNIYETLSQFIDEKTTIRVEIDSLTIWLTGKKNLTKIDQGWNGEIIEELSEIEQENRFEILQKLLLRFSKNGIIHADTVEIDSLSIPPGVQLKCNCLTLIDVPNSKQWLQKLKSTNFKKLHLALRDREENIGAEISRLKISESANFFKCSDVRDEDLIGVSGSDFRLYDGKISREFVKKMLEIHLKFGKRNDEFKVTLNLEGEDSDFDPFSFIPKNLKIRRIKKDGYTENAFLGNIFGGFENVHGIQDRRRLSIIPYDTRFSINCQIYKKPMAPFEMCPF
ncbi:hypothetical protein B9Z55_000561 [Caenorhabditis nigoni]|uniref:DUF38 domain-containing protein n=1 Tax=Caenorhabditis nigoni TaxID=1611254 RepID=A0A2G5VTP1_9PELO|nr:hypothetical protein B9Z55_000561 [Caenorhabditis nigoni]